MGEAATSVKEPTIIAYSKDKETLRSVVEGLTSHHMRVVGTSSLEGFEEALHTQAPDVIIVEDMARNAATKSSKQLAGLLSHTQEPIVVIVDEGQLLKRGVLIQAADFIIKPFDLVEALARIERVLQRHPPKEQADMRLAVGDLELDLKGFQLWIRGRPVHLTYKEQVLLQYLMASRGKAVTRGNILTNVWDYNFTGGLRTVDVHVRRLRAKLAASASCQIQTVVNVGYKFVVDVP